MENKALIGTITLLIFSLFGNVYQYNGNVPDTATHMCIVDNELVDIMFCDHLSSGIGTRCYQTTSSKANWKVCDSGWEEIDVIQKVPEQQEVFIDRIYCNRERCMAK